MRPPRRGVLGRLAQLPMTGDALTDRVTAGGPPLVMAIVRTAVAAVVISSSFAESPFSEPDPGFAWALAVAALYAIGSLGLALSDRPLDGRLTAGIDIALICVLMLLSGGAFADVRFALFLFPVIAAVTQSTQTTIRWAGMTPATYLLVAILDGTGEVPGRDETAATFSIYLAGVGAISVGISRMLDRRETRIQALAETSRTLAVRALEAEERERRRLAYALHDEPIQQLLSAQLDLDRAAGGDAEAAVEARRAVKATVGQLRETIFDLYPSSLEQLGIAAALEQVAERAAERSEAEIRLTIEPDSSGSRRGDGMLFTIARELLRNAVEHSGASVIELELEREGGELVLSVSDDGRGIGPGRREQALREGHLGLAAAAERAAALGGAMSVETAPGQGTTIEIRFSGAMLDG